MPTELREFELRIAREQAVRDLLDLTLAKGQGGAQPLRERRRALARFIRRVDEALEEAAEAPDVLLERRRRVVLGLALTAHGTSPGAHRSSSRRSPRTDRSQAPRVGAAGAGSRPAAGAYCAQWAHCSMHRPTAGLRPADPRSQRDGRILDPGRRPVARGRLDPSRGT